MLTDAQGEYSLGPYLYLLEDRRRAWSIAEVSAPDLAQQFAPDGAAVSSFDAGDSTYWLRVRVRNERARNTEWRLELGTPNMNSVEFYTPAVDGPGFEVRRTGDLLPFATRDVAHPYFVFRLRLEPHSEQTLYLRVANAGRTSLPLTLWSLEAFDAQEHTERFLAGLFYGILLIMLGYNLFLFLALREASYLYYVLFLASAVLAQAAGDGLAQEYLWPNLGWSNTASGIFFGICVALSLLQFTRTFLNLQTLLPTAHRILAGGIGLWAVLLVLAPLAGPGLVSPLFLVLILPTLVAVPVASLFAWRRGYRPARYFLAAWVVPAGGTVFYVLTRLGLLPGSPLAERGYQAGVVWLVLLLSLALADRINLIKREKEDAQAAALREHQEALQLKDQFAAKLQESRDELERHVAERTAELEAANRDLEAFSYSVSHDLRAPLRAVHGFAAAVLEDYGAELEGEGRRYLQLVLDSAVRMSQLIEDLLAFSRVGRQALAHQPVQLADLARQVMVELAPEYAGRQVELVVGDLPLCQGDPALLKQVLANLLSNAVKFTQPRPVARIELGWQPDASGAPDVGAAPVPVYFVRDNGVGFHMADASKLFGVFQRLPGAEAYEGTGVGLALVQRIVQRHGGRVWAEAEVERGATLYFVLGEGGA